MFQDSVPVGSYNDPFMSSVCVCARDRGALGKAKLYPGGHGKISLFAEAFLIVRPWQLKGAVGTHSPPSGSGHSMPSRHGHCGALWSRKGREDPVLLLREEKDQHPGRSLASSSNTREYQGTMLAVPEPHQPHPSQRKGDSLTQTRAVIHAHKLERCTNNRTTSSNKFLLKCQVAIGCLVFLQSVLHRFWLLSRKATCPNHRLSYASNVLHWQRPQEEILHRFLMSGQLNKLRSGEPDLGVEELASCPLSGSKHFLLPQQSFWPK